MSLAGLKNIFKSKKPDESQFILGIDLGDATSSICYFDALHSCTEIIDISGGYGKANMPTVIQYIPQSKEWVFGEYAVLNRGVGDDITFESLVEKLGRKEYVEIDGKLESVAGILSLFLKELMGNCKNINPKAEIAGIVVAVPSYSPKEALTELNRCFAITGVDRKIIEYVTDRECVFANYYFNRRPEKENILVLDYGSRQFRGGIYQVTPGQQITIKTVSYLFDGDLGARRFDESITGLFADLYSKETGTPKEAITPQIYEQITAFAYQHKDIIFQRSIFNRAVKLYFNFAYTPFQCSYSKSDADSFISPFKEKLYNFFNTLFHNNISNEKIDQSDISAIICVGGGFEMLWAREAVADFFPDSHITKYKNPKAAVAEGAAILAATYLEAIKGKTFIVEDGLQVTDDIGIYVNSEDKRKFLPIIEKDTFWWQNNGSARIIIDEKTEGTFSIEILKRNKLGEITPLGLLEVANYPKRAKGVIRFDLKLLYESPGVIKASLKDCGFGEFFSPAGFDMQYYLNVN